MNWSNFERELGAVVAFRRPVTGGDICQAYAIELASGQKVFVKTRADCDPDFFSAEARGLEWLAETQTLRVPRVLVAATDFLVLEWIEQGQPAADFDFQLGRGLAELHGHKADCGLPHRNFIGPLPQSNQNRHSWCEFWVEERLRPMLLRADRPSWEGRFQQLFRELPGWLTDEPLSRLHGDLWRGNVMVDTQGRPVLVDPSSYGGHGEVDLAMMALFGGFSPQVLRAYQQVRPLAEGWQRRQKLYQLYPLLVHGVLFGGSYVQSVEHCLQGLLAP